MRRYLQKAFYGGYQRERSFTRIDPAQEIARLRHSISLLEAYVFPAHRNQSGQAHRRTADSASLITPKKENPESSVEGKGAAPGMLGSQGQGGLYAGPTSAATHLLLVRADPCSSDLHIEPFFRTTSGAILTSLRADTKAKIEQQTTSFLLGLLFTTGTFWRCYPLLRPSTRSSITISNTATGSIVT